MAKLTEAEKASRIWYSGRLMTQEQINVLRAKSLARGRLWRDANREHVRARSRESNRKWRAANAEKHRANNWRQRGVPAPTRPCPEACEICGAAAWLELRGLHLDHSHATDKFRGWLCGSCNRALGLLKDSPEVCRKAAAYLEQNS